MSKRVVVEMLVEVPDNFTTDEVSTSVQVGVNQRVQADWNWNIIQTEAHTVDRRNKKVVLAKFPSESDPSKDMYEVCERSDGTLYCTCPGYQWNRTCWHIDVMKQRRTAK